MSLVGSGTELLNSVSASPAFPAAPSGEIWPGSCAGATVTLRVFVVSYDQLGSFVLFAVCLHPEPDLLTETQIAARLDSSF